VPPELGDLAALRRLSLSRNRVASLPDSVSRYVAVFSFALLSDSLSVRLTALETLDLACNLLESLPAGLAALPSLLHLNVASNCLPAADFLRACGPALRVLHLGYNPLDGARLPLDGLVGLTDLNLSGLGLAELPSYLSALQELQVCLTEHILSLCSFSACCSIVSSFQFSLSEAS
jgi:Leucine-rich repeat (LRR) protein